MSRLVSAQLDSYELAHYAVEVPCFVCDGGNRHDAERCRHCYAPLALRYQVTDKLAKSSDMIAILGPRDAGKTSYLGMLCDTLSRQSESCQAISRGAFSVMLQQRVIATLTSQQFPPHTSEEAENWHWNHLSITEPSSRRQRELIFPDMSGAAMERELDHQASPITRAYLKKCSGAIILLDTQRIEQGDPVPDFFAMKALSYLGEFGGKRREAWANKPIAFVFTKSDQSQACFEAPRSYAETHVPGLYRRAVATLKRSEFFGVSVAGATLNLEVDGAPMSLPLRIEPRGICEPVTWLLKQLR
ncbi:MAG: hypothetical protein H6822_32425 [Planctomycetaceae bacterium]|nr:hypothetical protein [Planctomycetales bacterium]MCB9926892.1 hypothetical protein [Planctomycetaceae bacterium]